LGPFGYTFCISFLSFRNSFISCDLFATSLLLLSSVNMSCWLLNCTFVSFHFASGHLSSLSRLYLSYSNSFPRRSSLSGSFTAFLSIHIFSSFVEDFLQQLARSTDSFSLAHATPTMSFPDRSFGFARRAQGRMGNYQPFPFTLLVLPLFLCLFSPVSGVSWSCGSYFSLSSCMLVRCYSRPDFSSQYSFYVSLLCSYFDLPLISCLCPLSLVFDDCDRFRHRVFS